MAHLGEDVLDERVPVPHAEPDLPALALPGKVVERPLDLAVAARQERDDAVDRRAVLLPIRVLPADRAVVVDQGLHGVGQRQDRRGSDRLFAVPHATMLFGIGGVGVEANEIGLEHHLVQRAAGLFVVVDVHGDGRATVADARIIAGAAEKVEQRYPHLIGGIGIYAPTGAHCGMVHIDTRGHRARW